MSTFLRTYYEYWRWAGSIVCTEMITCSSGRPVGASRRKPDLKLSHAFFFFFFAETADQSTLTMLLLC